MVLTEPVTRKVSAGRKMKNILSFLCSFCKKDKLPTRIKWLVKYYQKKSQIFSTEDSRYKKKSRGKFLEFFLIKNDLWEIYGEIEFSHNFFDKKNYIIRDYYLEDGGEEMCLILSYSDNESIVQKKIVSFETYKKEKEAIILKQEESFRKKMALKKIEDAFFHDSQLISVDGRINFLKEIAEKHQLISKEKEELKNLFSQKKEIFKNFFLFQQKKKGEPRITRIFGGDFFLVQNVIPSFANIADKFGVQLEKSIIIHDYDDSSPFSFSFKQIYVHRFCQEKDGNGFEKYSFDNENLFLVGKEIIHCLSEFSTDMSMYKKLLARFSYLPQIRSNLYKLDCLEKRKVFSRGYCNTETDNENYLALGSIRKNEIENIVSVLISTETISPVKELEKMILDVQKIGEVWDYQKRSYMEECRRAKCYEGYAGMHP